MKGRMTELFQPRMRGRRLWVRFPIGPGWIVTGLMLLVLFCGLLAVSFQFDFERPDADKPIRIMVALMILAGAVYLAAVSGLHNVNTDRACLVWICLVGVLLRLSLFFSVPMLEDDHYRYLWDGAVVANGFNPYRYSPSELQAVDGTPVPSQLHRLAEKAGEVIRRINHPWLRTIYPPIAQGVFAAAHLIYPWSMTAWRLMLLMFDCLTLMLLFRLLQYLKQPLAGLAVYWWNPLFIKEIYNSGHLDVLILPFLLTAVILAHHRRYQWSAGFIGLAYGVKLWPVVLLPVVVRLVLRRPAAFFQALLIFSVLAAGLFLPYMLTGLDPASGLTAYRRYWEMNDALFMAILWTAKWGLQEFARSTAPAQTVARGLVFALMAGWTLWVVRKEDGDLHETIRRCLLVSGGLFLLSPTQFPWYFVWLLPFLTIVPNRALLLYTVLLPVYYLRFYFEARGRAELFDNGVVWLEHLPVLGWIVWMWLKSKRMKSSRCASMDEAS